MAPRSQEQFYDIRQASIQKIVTAAIKLFAKNGYLSVSVKDIAREAGISQGLMYNYFNSKEKLLTYIIDDLISGMSEMMKSAYSAGTPAERLRLMIQLPFQSFRERKEFWEMIMRILSQQAVSVKVKKQLQQLFQSTVMEMEVIFKALKVPQPKLEAYKLGAILDGIGWGCMFVFQDDYPLDEMEKKLLKDYERLTESK